MSSSFWQDEEILQGCLHMAAGEMEGREGRPLSHGGTAQLEMNFNKQQILYLLYV